ncbi:M20/M25/M40 family metallo-hydrolase [Neobacillus sp. SM06]|uniref:M20/M25/M40 family metallo-hydrolase n=1 Tax=Neobacillus sp. SM06 TaxID=3422492 RepID=UPI003D2A134B
MKQKLDEKWQSVDQLKNLLIDLVKIPSITGTADEVRFSNDVFKMLQDLAYFQEHPEHLKLHGTNDGRKILTALVKKGNCKDTVILLSHFDVVGVDDYGRWKELAFDPERLAEAFTSQLSLFSEEIQNDLRSGEWMFGRGTMDMKSGLALHMSILEKAAMNHFNGNVLLLTVCDEEVNSTGMRSAIPVIQDIAEKFALKYQLCINSEPIFSNYPGDQTKYVYTGSLGKVLPAFYCMGKETHAAEPFTGLNANYLASMVTCEMELNTIFCESVEGETTPPPTNLWQKDLKQGYSVQIPDRAVTLFNLFLMEKPLNQLAEELKQVASHAARKTAENYSRQKGLFTHTEEKLPNNFTINVFSFEELLLYAEKKLGEDRIHHLYEKTISDIGMMDDRERSILLVDQLAQQCKELSPMIVLFFAPPYYPAVCSSKNETVTRLVPKLIDYAKNQHDLELVQQNYFSGLSDLSYIGPSGKDDIQILSSCMPLWNKGYHIPSDLLNHFQIPVLNLGPWGKDPHKMSERLHIQYSFDKTRDMLEFTVKQLFLEN